MVDVEAIWADDWPSSLSTLLIFPRFSCSEPPLTPTPTLVSSRKLHAGNNRGDEGRARETRRCCFELWEFVKVEDGGGNGAVNEKAEVGGSLELAVWLAITVVQEQVGFSASVVGGRSVAYRS